MSRLSTPKAAMLIACAAIAFASQPAAAKDTAKGKWSQDKAQGYCDAKEGSTSWKSPDGAEYGCGYKGGGGLICNKDSGCVESDGQLEEGQEQERQAPWGFVGLVGLIGLFGLSGRRRRDGDPLR